VVGALHRHEVDPGVRGGGPHRSQRVDVARAAGALQHEDLASHRGQPAAWRAELHFARIRGVEWQAGLAILLHVLHGAECKGGAEPSRDLGGEQRQGPARAVASQVDARGVDGLLLRKEVGSGEDVVDLAEEGLLHARITAASAQRGVHREDLCLAERARRLVVVRRSIGPAAVVDGVRVAAGDPHDGRALPAICRRDAQIGRHLSGGCLVLHRAQQRRGRRRGRPLRGLRAEQLGLEAAARVGERPRLFVAGALARRQRRLRAAAYLVIPGWWWSPRRGPTARSRSWSSRRTRDASS